MKYSIERINSRFNHLVKRNPTSEEVQLIQNHSKSLSSAICDLLKIDNMGINCQLPHCCGSKEDDREPKPVCRGKCWSNCGGKGIRK